MSEFSDAIDKRNELFREMPYVEGNTPKVDEGRTQEWICRDWPRCKGKVVMSDRETRKPVCPECGGPLLKFAEYWSGATLQFRGLTTPGKA